MIWINWRMSPIGALAVRFQQIQKYECAGNRISVAMLWKLACVLDVDVGYFFAGLERPAEARPAPEPVQTPAQPRAFDAYGRAA
jgi:transcriptional regulator with XRE-family HTH domain